MAESGRLKVALCCPALPAGDIIQTMKRLCGLFLCSSICTLLLTSAVFAAPALTVGQTMKLNVPQLKGKISLEQSLSERRSQRDFSADDLGWNEVSQLLWAGQGITDSTWGFRTAPSAGALFPITLYVCRADGIYEYIPQGHQVKMIAAEDRRLALSQASLAQAFVAQAPVCIVIASNIKKVRPKYGGRSDRYVYIEAGHVAENILLQATTMGLAAVPVGAFWDDIARRVLALPEDQDPLYIVPVGYPK